MKTYMQMENEITIYLHSKFAQCYSESVLNLNLDTYKCNMCHISPHIYHLNAYKFFLKILLQYNLLHTVVSNNVCEPSFIAYEAKTSLKANISLKIL